MILIALSILWLVFSLIPTRFVILLGGLVSNAQIDQHIANEMRR
jgi:hypothetical protein